MFVIVSTGAIYFVERIGVFFLYDVVDQCRIFFGSKHVGQSFEKTPSSCAGLYMSCDASQPSCVCAGR